MSEAGEPGGGQSALLVSVAHLDELIGALDAVNGRAMFLVGLNVASNSLFIAVLASLQQPWEAAIFPVAVALLTVGIGLWTLGQRNQPQFPAPAAVRQAAGQGITDDRLAWLAVAAIDSASRPLALEVQRVSRWVTALQTLTAGHLIGLALTGLVLVV